MYPRGQLSERRFEPRFPYPHLLYLTPLAKNGVDTQGDSIVVVGKDLSESGMSFFHPRPLADRHMIVSLEAGGSQWLRLSDRYQLVPLHAARLVFQRRAVPGNPDLAARRAVGRSRRWPSVATGAERNGCCRPVCPVLCQPGNFSVGPPARVLGDALPAEQLVFQFDPPAIAPQAAAGGTTRWQGMATATGLAPQAWATARTVLG